jgi:hypothetical protein
MSAARRETTTAQSYSLVRLSSRLQAFTVSPMAVMICEPGGPIAPTMASLKWMPIPIRIGCGKSPRIRLLSWATRASNLARSTQGVGGADRGVFGVETVKRHQPIAGELRIVTVGGSERFDHLVEELIENVEEVVGKLGLAQDRGTAQIDEHHRDQPLASLEPRADHTVGCSGIGSQQGHDRDVRGRTNLTGQPHAGRRSDTGQCCRLRSRRFGQLAQPLCHQDPARRAARSSPTD